MKKQNRYTEYMDENAVKIDEYAEGQAYSVFESEKEFFEQWAKDNAQEQAGTIRAVVIKLVKTCKNGNICIAGSDTLTNAFCLHFLPKGKFAGLCPEIAKPKPVFDDENIPVGVEIVDDEILTTALKDRLLVLSNDTPIKIK